MITFVIIYIDHVFAYPNNPIYVCTFVHTNLTCKTFILIYVRVYAYICLYICLYMLVYIHLYRPDGDGQRHAYYHTNYIKNTSRNIKGKL